MRLTVMKELLIISFYSRLRSAIEFVTSFLARTKMDHPSKYATSIMALPKMALLPCL
jgi:hypothetical protein